jgi:FkbM family methyltransferase
MRKCELLLYPYEQQEPVQIDTAEQSSFEGSRDESLALMRSLIEPGDLVFDVGANNGMKTELFLACGAKVVCFEPQPQFVKELRAKFKGDPNVMIALVGLGKEREFSREMFVCAKAPNISTLSKDFTVQSRFVRHGYKWNDKLKINLTTLDLMIEKHGRPKFCKIDVEGFEFEVFSGLHRTIPWIAFEFNIDQIKSSKRCLEYLTNLGYTEFNFVPAERGLFISPIWMNANELVKAIERMSVTYDFSVIWGLWGDIYARHS